MSGSLPTRNEAKRRTCGECGQILPDVASFHPYAFCQMFKAGLDPWEDFRWMVERVTGRTDLPEKAPRVRDLPLPGWKS